MLKFFLCICQEWAPKRSIELYNKRFIELACFLQGRRGGLMVSELNSGSSSPGSSPGRGHCVVFLGKTLYSHNASLHPGAKRLLANLMLGVTLRWTGIPSRGE